MRRFTAACLQLAPAAAPLTPAVVEANCSKAASWVERCVASTGADLVVLPETASTGFVTDCAPDRLWDLVSEVPGPVTKPLQAVAKKHRVHIVWGTYERGPTRDTLYNAAALIGPSGEVVGVYRKTHPFVNEGVDGGGWVTPGDQAPVFDTELGRIAMQICFDGDFPELARIQAVLGAEIVVRSSALLRSADVWELTTRARAYDNHVFVLAANATGTDPGGVHYFGNSLIATPAAEILARGTSHESWVSAVLDPERAMSPLSPGSSIPQSFDHLAVRNLTMIRRHVDDITRPANAALARTASPPQQLAGSAGGRQ